MTNVPTAHEFHFKHGIGNDGADVHAMAHRQPSVGNAVYSIFIDLHFSVFIVLLQGLSTDGDEPQGLQPFVFAHFRKTIGGADHRQKILRCESFSDGKGAQKLNEHIKAEHHRLFAFYELLADGFLQSCGFHEFQRVCGQEPDLAHFAGAVTASSCAL